MSGSPDGRRQTSKVCGFFREPLRIEWTQKFIDGCYHLRWAGDKITPSNTQLRTRLWTHRRQESRFLFRQTSIFYSILLFLKKSDRREAECETLMEYLVQQHRRSPPTHQANDWTAHVSAVKHHLWSWKDNTSYNPLLLQTTPKLDLDNSVSLELCGTLWTRPIHLWGFRVVRTSREPMASVWICLDR